MVTVRFPTGFSVQYNTATYVNYLDGGTIRLRSGKDGPWIADIYTASGAIIEVSSPCRTYDAKTVDAGDLAKQVLQSLRVMNPYDVTRIKTELAKFNSHTKEWRK